MCAAEAVHQEKREMEIPGNGKKILGISSNYRGRSVFRESELPPIRQSANPPCW